MQIVKAAVRELWALEYEIEEIQTEFAKGIGSIDIGNLTDDFVEDVMLQSKPLQGILMAIRIRQKVQCVSSSPAKKSTVPDLASHASRYDTHYVSKLPSRSHMVPISF